MSLADVVPGGLGIFRIVTIDPPSAPLDQYQEWLRGVELGRGFPFKIHLSTVDGKVYARAECVDSTGRYGGQITVTFDYVVPLQIRTKGEFLRYVRWILHQVVCHEVDESLTVDGYHEFDPHRNARPGFSDPAYDWKPGTFDLELTVPVKP